MLDKIVYLVIIFIKGGDNMAKISIKQVCQSISPLLVLSVIESGDGFKIKNFVKMTKPILDKTGRRKEVFEEIKKVLEIALEEVKKIT